MYNKKVNTNFILFICYTKRKYFKDKSYYLNHIFTKLKIETY